MMPPKIGDPVEMLQTPFVRIVRFPADFGEFRKNYDVVVFGPRAGVVAVNGDRILMIRQYRFLPNALSWEIPGGTVEPGEDPAVSAQRECLEETGVLCEDLNPLITYWPGLDNVDNETTIYSCIKSRQVHPFQPNPSEVVEIAWMPLMDVMGMVMGGEIKDVFTQTAMLSFTYSRLRSG